MGSRSMERSAVSSDNLLHIPSDVCRTSSLSVGWSGTGAAMFLSMNTFVPLLAVYVPFPVSSLYLRGFPNYVVTSRLYSSRGKVLPGFSFTGKELLLHLVLSSFVSVVALEIGLTHPNESFDRSHC